MYSDFNLTFDFRVVVEHADAAVVVRTWTGRGGWPEQGYRIRLSDSGSNDAAGLLIGRLKDVVELTAAAPAWRNVRKWQTYEIAAEGRRVSLSLNGRPAGIFEVEERAGHVLFEVRDGVLELRNIAIRRVLVNDDRPANAVTLDSLSDEGGTPPRPISQVEPRYTYEAMLRKIEGVVTLEAVVLPDGAPTGIRVIRPLDPDLDEVAVAALRRWRFTPATVRGQQVPAIITVEMRFSMR